MSQQDNKNHSNKTEKAETPGTVQEDVCEPKAAPEQGDATAATEDTEVSAELVMAALSEERAALIEERDALKDQILRARAEFDNYRKRMQRETERIRKTAAESVIRDLLPVVDNIERALSHAEDTSAGLGQGVLMVARQLAELLSRQGVEPIPAVGQPFDPNVHEALARIHSAEVPEESVAQEFERGYRMGDFVIRPSKVVVSAGPEKNDAEEIAADQATD